LRWKEISDIPTLTGVIDEGVEVLTDRRRLYCKKSHLANITAVVATMMYDSPVFSSPPNIANTCNLCLHRIRRLIMLQRSGIVTRAGSCDKTRCSHILSGSFAAVTIEGCQKQLLCFGEFCVFSISQSFRTGDAKNSDTVLFWSAVCSIFMDRRMLAPTSDLCGSDKGKGSPPLAGQPALSRILQGSPPLAGQPSNKGQGSPLSLVGQPALISKLLGSPPLAGSILPFLL